MGLAYNIRFLRKKREWSQDELAKISGVGKSTIQLYESEKTSKNPTRENLQKLANAFDVDISGLTNENLSISKSISQEGNVSINHKNPSISPSNLKNANEEDAEKIMAIPYFEDTYASAGEGAVNYDEAPTTIEFSESFLRNFLGISGNLSNVHIINARGDSMEPTLTDGELLFVRAIKNESEVVSGYVYAIRYGEDTFVKRVERNPVTKAITLFSDNEKYEPIAINGENLKNCTVVGRVVAHIKRGTI